MNGQTIYKTKTICINCFNINETEIPYKTLVADYLYKQSCKICGNDRVLQQVRPTNEE